MRLIAQTGPEAGQQFSLHRGMTTIGRGPGNDISLSDSQVSRRHCQISWGPEGCIITDLGSTNGTFVNEVRITAPHPLRHGDRIRVGTTTFSFEEVPVAPPVGPPLAPAVPGGVNILPFLLIGGAVLAAVIGLLLLKPPPPTPTPETFTPTATIAVSPTPTSTPIAPTSTPLPTPTFTPTKRPPTPTFTPTPLVLLEELIRSIRSVREALGDFGWQIDRAVSIGLGYIEAEKIVELYEEVEGAPSYDIPADQEDLQWVHSNYRKGVDIFLVGARDMYLNCKDFLKTGEGYIPEDQWARARKAIKDADEDYLGPALDRAEELRR